MFTSGGRSWTLSRKPGQVIMEWVKEHSLVVPLPAIYDNIPDAAAQTFREYKRCINGCTDKSDFRHLMTFFVLTSTRASPHTATSQDMGD